MSSPATLPTPATTPGDYRNNWVRSSPRDTDQDAGFGDAIWDGDYQNPDSYTGGIPVDLAITRELMDDFEAWYDQPPPEESGLRRQLRAEYGWADEWWGEPPEPQPRAISWISCRPPRERHTK